MIAGRTCWTETYVGVLILVATIGGLSLVGLGVNIDGGGNGDEGQNDNGDLTAKMVHQLAMEWMFFKKRKCYLHDWFLS